MITDSNRLKWYAVHTMSRHEKVVNKHLKAKNIPIFLPLIEVWSRRKDRKKRIKVPLFKGYLFVNIFLDNNKHLEIIKTPGVVNIIGNQSEPLPIPDEQINSIRLLLENDVLITPVSYLKVGQRVKIVNGPLTGVEGILLKNYPNKKKLVVSVDLLQRSVSVDVNSIDVEIID